MSPAAEPSPRSAALHASVLTLVVFAFAALGAWLSHAGVFARSKSGLVVTSDVLVHALLLTGLVWAMLRVSGQRWAAIGLGREPLLSVVIYGIAATVFAYVANALAVLVHLAITRPDLTAVGEQKLRALDPLAAIPLWALVPIAVVVGVYEEIVFRGFLLTRLRTAFSGRFSPKTAAIAAVLVSSSVFAFGHLYQGALGVVQTAAAGIALSVIALWRRSLWPCIFAHVAIDVFGLIALRVLGPMLDSLPPP
jgi:membrane protease YdiL (CAAX protease family)